MKTFCQLGRWAALLGVTIMTAFAQTPLKITRADLSGENLALSWEGGSGSYELQAASALQPGQWHRLLRTSLTDARITRVGPHRFFRLLTAPPPASTPITDTRRLQLLDTIARQIATLTGDAPRADSEQLAAFLSTFSEFSGVGVSEDDSVWARFTDGRPLLLANNRPPATPEELNSPDALALPTAALSSATTPTAASPALHSLNISPPSGLPVSSRAVLFKASLPAINAPMVQYLTPLLRRQGYEVVGGEASLDNLINTKNYGADIGLFYLDSHGGFVEAQSEFIDPETHRSTVLIYPLFVVATSTVVDPSNQPAYAANLARGTIAYSLPSSGLLKGLARDPSGTKPLPLERQAIYCITGEFVRQHWTFSRNSLVYIDTCLSASPDAAPFRDICRQKGAAVVAGWSQKVYDPSASKVTRLLFDTLLGGSQIFPATPAQRPFDLAAVYRYLVRTGLDTDPKYGGAIQFFLDAANGSFGLLAPSIRQMSAAIESGQVYLDGLFDPATPATVRVEGAGAIEFQATPVDRTTLVVPWSGDQSPSVGNVTVIQRGHRSNTAPLTQWRVAARMRRPYANAQRDPFALLDFDLRLRADLHKARLEPFASPVFLANSAIAEPGSTARVLSVAGMYDEGRVTIQWELPAPVDLPRVWYFDPTGSLGFKARVIFPSEGLTRFEASATARDTMTIITTTREGVETRTPGDPAGIATHPNTQGAISPAYAILAGDDSSSAGAQAFGSRFSWSSAEAQNPPDPTQPGYAE